MTWPSRVIAKVFSVLTSAWLTSSIVLAPAPSSFRLTAQSHLVAAGCRALALFELGAFDDRLRQQELLALVVTGDQRNVRVVLHQRSRAVGGAGELAEGCDRLAVGTVCQASGSLIWSSRDGASGCPLGDSGRVGRSRWGCFEPVILRRLFGVRGEARHGPVLWRRRVTGFGLAAGLRAAAVGRALGFGRALGRGDHAGAGDTGVRRRGPPLAAGPCRRPFWATRRNRSWAWRATSRRGRCDLSPGISTTTYWLD